MSYLFCMYCLPPAPGKHQEHCQLYKEPNEAVLDQFEDVLKKAADLTGQDIDVSGIMDEARKKNDRSGKMESTGEA